MDDIFEGLGVDIHGLAVEIADAILIANKIVDKIVDRRASDYVSVHRMLLIERVLLLLIDEINALPGRKKYLLMLKRVRGEKEE